MKTNSKYQSEVEVIVRFLRGELSETENKKFRQWLNKKQENRSLFEETKKIWEHSDNLSSLESIDVNKDWKKIRQRIDFVKEKKTYQIRLTRNFRLLKIAATIIVLIGIGFLAQQFLFTPAEILVVETSDYTKEIILPDGSYAYLNHNSSLQYPEKFSKESRQIKLSGEGYFDVTKNPDKRFQISIDHHAVVEVLGTSFNIKSEKDKGTVDVNVISGKVAFYPIENENLKTILTKNDNALLQDGIIHKNLTKDKNFLSWRTGVIYFEDDNIDQVCKVLSDFYRRTIVSEGLENSDIRFTSTIDNQKLKDVLEEIKLVLNLDYSIKNRKIIISKKK